MTHIFKLPAILRLSTKALFFLSLAALVSMFSMYVFLVNKTVMNVVARQEAEKNISALSSSLGEQEFQYIALKNSVTIELAHSKGFEDAFPTTFLARKKPASPLSYQSSR